MGERGILDLLARYPLRVQPLDEPEDLGGAGGLSGARLWRYRSGQGTLALRGWPPGGPTRAHLEQVHHWLLQASDLGFVPTPTVDRSGGTLQEYEGRFWEVGPWMPGAVEVARPPAPARVRAAFAALAAFHQRLVGERRAGTSPGLAQRHAAVAQLLRGGFDELERALHRPDAGPPDEARSMALRWLGLARTVAPRLLDPLREAAGRTVPLQPCLRDARPEHFLFEDDRVTGLVDFGAMGIDCVAGDLARLMGEWLDDDRSARADALAAYERIRPLDAAEAALIDAFASSSALLIGEHWIRWHFIEGRRFDDPSVVREGITRGLAHLERLADGEAFRTRADPRSSRNRSAGAGPPPG
jgi:Ser/Thr protein kinase RdoA (MazF antagonist)